MDKDVFKTLMRGAGVPVARHVALRLGDPVENPFGYPVFVEAGEHGLVGRDLEGARGGELEAAVALARRHDEKVMIEEFVDGTEVEVGVLGNLPRPIASLPGEVDRAQRRLVRLLVEVRRGRLGARGAAAGPRPRRRSSARASSRVAAFVATSCEGMARADFFVRASDGEVRDERAEHDPGLHVDELLRPPLRRLGDRLRASCSTASIELALERHERRSGLEY